MQSFAPQKKLIGPPNVRPWHKLNTMKDGVPCVLERKFDYVRGRHRRLAKVEAQLRECRALPAEQRHPDAIENLTMRRDNAKAWLEFSLATLEEHLRLATARSDGSLDALHPLPSGGKRSVSDKVAKLVAYYNEALEEFKLAAAASAGIWKRTVCGGGKPCAEYRSGETKFKVGNKEIVACKHVIADHERKPLPGHAGTDDAVKALIEHAKPIIETFKRKSGREAEVAEQLAWIEVVETAARFDPTEGRGARFNTYYTYRCRRATQIRSPKDAPPGKTMIKGKLIARGTIHPHDDERSPDLYHPTVVENHDGAKEAVANALALLSTEEQEVATRHLIEKVSLRKLAEERGVSLHQIRKLVTSVTTKLQASLKEFA